MHLLAVLEYDGTDFVGFQRQKRGRTVQETLEDALGEFGDEPIRIVGGGRTDAGVHALGQTSSFRIDWAHDLPTLQRAINAKLPCDLAVQSLRQVPEDFSARFSAKSRTYLYAVLNQPQRSPLQERYALRYAGTLDVESMRIGALQLVGRHDLGAFGTPPRGENTVRELMRAEVRRQEARITFEIEANAFLYRMARRIVGTLLLLGRGEIDLDAFRKVIARERRAGDAAPAHGLTLVQVKYDLET